MTLREYDEVPDDKRVGKEETQNGLVYAYHSDGEHVVVHDDGEGRSELARTPAYRDTVWPDERLWTIPENWRPKAKYRHEDGSRDTIYRVPQTNSFVRATVVEADDPTTERFQVMRLGSLDTTYVGGCDWSRLRRVIADETIGETIDRELRPRLEELSQNTDSFEASLAEMVTAKTRRVVTSGPVVVDLDEGVFSTSLDIPEYKSLLKKHSGANIRESKVKTELYTFLKRQDILPHTHDVAVDVEQWDAPPRSYAVKRRAGPY